MGWSNTNQRVFIVAEAGNNHEGCLEHAFKLVESAAMAGADVIKFQTFIPNLYVASEEQERLALLKTFQLSFSDFEKLAEHAKRNKIEFLSTPFDLESAKFLNKIQNFFKISSGDNNFLDLLYTVKNFKKPTMISTGLARWDEIQRVIEIWGKDATQDNLALLHCVSAYPVPEAQAALEKLYELRNRFPEISLGYSDHTKGQSAALLSVGAGARIIEKHFTLDNNFSDFRDHKMSLDPQSFSNFVESIRAAEKMIFSSSEELIKLESPVLRAARRSAAASRDLPSGTVLTLDDLIWVRPGHGFSPDKGGCLVGKKLKKAMPFGSIFVPENLL